MLVTPRPAGLLTDFLNPHPCPALRGHADSLGEGRSANPRHVHVLKINPKFKRYPYICYLIRNIQRPLPQPRTASRCL